MPTIHFQPGMPLTAEILNAITVQFQEQQNNALRALIGTRFGILPNTHCSLSGAVVRNTFEATIHNLYAILPDGTLIQADDTYVINLPEEGNEALYLTLTPDNSTTEFSRNGLPLVRPNLKLEFHTLTSIFSQLPLFKFEGGTPVSYIPPTLQISTDPRISQMLQQLAESLAPIASHDNLVDASARQALLQMLFRLRTLHATTPTLSMLQFAQQLAQAVNYFVFPQAEQHSLCECTLFDIQQYLDQVAGLLSDAKGYLDKLVITTEEIDYSQLKEEIRTELLSQIQPHLEASLHTQIESLSSDLNTRISDSLRDYVDGTVRASLQEEISATLSASLNESLYGSLYQALYDALYHEPVTPEDLFVPMI